ncbi:hypothetical protein [Psychrobacter pygoscelis]|uniref:hypothetical protein n=1 Tax=Psychrobacter pygoscelis TaxID=2488563 RepID=UPI0010402D23|nr:hypothetical protein [Psychrobacter pygoscelis]
MVQIMIATVTATDIFGTVWQLRSMALEKSAAYRPYFYWYRDMRLMKIILLFMRIRGARRFIRSE